MKKLLVVPIMLASVWLSFGNELNSKNAFSVSEIQHLETTTFKVYGNCNMCKKTIESSLKDVEGIQKADWDVKSKMMTITFNPHQISLKSIKEKIASVGYDTDEVKAQESVYNKLPNCCQYERAK